MTEITLDDEDADFDLGETNDESDAAFQISINFEGDNIPTPQNDEVNEPSSKYDPEKPRFMDWVFDIAEMFVFVLAVVILLTSFVFRHSIVEGQSMMNTLADGDHLIISDLFYTPERGDIIVFADYEKGQTEPLIKRVIGVAGDVVEVTENYLVYVNGELLDEDYVLADAPFHSSATGVWTWAESPAVWEVCD